MTAAEATPSLLKRLINGQADLDFIGRSRSFALFTVALLAIAAAAVLLRGLNFSIEFTGGSSFRVTDATAAFTVAELEEAVLGLGVEEAIVQIVDEGTGAQVSTPAITELNDLTEPEVAAAIAEIAGVDAGSVTVDSVGPRWGAQITRQALQGLAVFLVLVAGYISFRFEWRMAAAALATLLHDIAVTVGLYALIGFPVSPASVIAFLTILGYSLYDTVVVFDRVDEDTGRLTSASSRTYAQEANTALNEVLVRSLSTAATSALPVATLLVVGAGLAGAETLADLALALLIGSVVGSFSSITVATPLLVWLKEREPRYAELKERLAVRRGEIGG